MTGDAIPALARGVRLRAGGSEPQLLIPEGLLTLNATAAAALAEVDGSRTIVQIAAALQGRFSGASPETLERDVRELFEALHARALIVCR